ncbi:MAG: response regulator [Phycisphaerae bacterium]|jgi:two-component system chemotaxis response regulator CheY|nr:response regulator [Phycisphaerae bacterium]
MRVLVVDDDVVSREKMAAIVKRFGPSVAVESGTIALNCFFDAWNSWAPFDLITLDISMPGQDGLETLQKIRALEKEKNVPPHRQVKIIMVTGEADKEIVLTCIRQGCNDYVVKPFDRETVEQKVRKLFDRPPSTLLENS